MIEPASSLTIAAGGVGFAAGGPASVIISAGFLLVGVIAMGELVYYFCKKIVQLENS